MNFMLACYSVGQPQQLAHSTLIPLRGAFWRDEARRAWWIASVRIPLKRIEFLGLAQSSSGAWPANEDAFGSKRDGHQRASMSKTILFLLACRCAIQVANARTTSNPPFMLVSGISAPAEMCVVVENGRTPTTRMLVIRISL